MWWLIGYIIGGSVLTNAGLMWVVIKLLKREPGVDRGEYDRLKRERDRIEAMRKDAVQANVNLAKLYNAVVDEQFSKKPHPL